MVKSSLELPVPQSDGDKLSEAEIETLVRLLHAQASHSPASKCLGAISAAPGKAIMKRKMLPGNASPSQQNDDDNSVDTEVKDYHTHHISKGVLRTCMYQLKNEYLQLKSSDNVKRIVCQIHTCLIEQGLTPSSFFEIAQHKHYTNPKAFKSFTLTKADEMSIVDYLVQRCGSSPEVGRDALHQRKRSMSLARLFFSFRNARRTHYRLKMTEKQIQTVVHFANLLDDGGTSLADLLQWRRKDAEEDAPLEDIAASDMGTEQIAKAISFIDNMGNGDGEVEVGELRMAFRRARQMVAQSNPESVGRQKTHKLAKALKALNLTAKEWFSSHAATAGGVRSEDNGVGQLVLFKALRRMSNELLIKLPTKESAGLAFTDDCILEMMSFLDPNQDGTVTLQEIEDGLQRARNSPDGNSEQAAAARVLKALEFAMLEEGGDINEIFKSIDEDGSGSVNTEELTAALKKFHQLRMKRLRLSQDPTFTRRSSSAQQGGGGRFALNNESFSRPSALNAVESWMRDRNVHDADFSPKDIDVFMNFLDPYYDNEITVSEITDALEYARGETRYDHSKEFKAARLLSRCHASMFARGVTTYELFLKSLDLHAREEEESAVLLHSNGDRNISEKSADENAGESKESSISYSARMRQLRALDEDWDSNGNLFADCAKPSLVGCIAEAIALTVEEDISGPAQPSQRAMVDDMREDMPTTKSSDNERGAAAGSSSPSPAFISKKALALAISDVCHVSNRRVDIFNAGDILAAAAFVSVGDRGFCILEDVIGSFLFASTDYNNNSRHAERVSELQLVTRLELQLSLNNHKLGGLFDSIVRAEGDAKLVKSTTKNGEAERARAKSPPNVVSTAVVSSIKKGGAKKKVFALPTVYIFSFVTKAQVDAADAVRSCAVASPVASMRRRQFADNSPEKLKESRLKRLAGLSPEEDDKVTTATEPPAPSWSEIEHMKKSLVGDLKASDVVRISATVGFCNSLAEQRQKLEGKKIKWVNFYTGHVKECDFKDILEGFSRKSKPLTLFTFRAQQITLIGRSVEKFKVVSYNCFMTGATAPTILEAGKRSVKVAWPKFDTKRLGDCSVKLSLEVCPGREWRTGKCRGLANTLSLLTSSGKKSFRTVYEATFEESGMISAGEQVNAAEAARKSYDGGSGNKPSGKIMVTDLEPARWYHLRFRISYKVLPALRSHEEEMGFDDEFKMIETTSRGRTFGGVRSTSTAPDVPEAPGMPRFLLSHTQRVMPMGSKVSVKAKIKIHWNECRCNGFKIRYYILQRKVKRVVFEGGGTRTENEDERDDGGGKGGEQGAAAAAAAAWGNWETIYSNQFAQYFCKSPPAGTVGMMFRLCAVNSLGGGPWGEPLLMSGDAFKDFFESGSEEGVGSVGGEGGLDKFRLERDQQLVLKEAGIEARNNKIGKTIRKRIEREGEDKVIAFGRSVRDNTGVFGGGKMKMRKGGAEYFLSPIKMAGGGRGMDAKEIQLERNARVIKDQMGDFPVSVEAARRALRSVGGGYIGGDRVMMLVSGRDSPSPINYLSAVRRERRQRADGDWPGVGYVGARGGRGAGDDVAPPLVRPKTADALTEKWVADGRMEK